MRILGIDIGSSTIKAVEVESAFGRFEIRDARVVTLPSDGNLEASLSTLLSGTSKKPDRTIIALPTSQTTFRNLQLPTRDKKAIQTGIGFEIEDELPFSMEDMTYDYTPLSQGKQGTSVHVAATLKSHLAKFIEKTVAGSVDPDIITTEAWAYRGLLNRFLPGQYLNSILLFDLGQNKSTLYLHWQQAPAYVAEIEWGGQDIDQFICKEREVPLDQAEEIKKKEPLEKLIPALERMVGEIRHAGLISQNITQQGITKIYLTGGTSQLAGLAPWIEKQVEIPTQLLSEVLPQDFGAQSKASFSLAMATALSTVGVDRNSWINFRKGAFSKSGTQKELNLKVFKKPLMAVGVVAFSLFLSLVVQSTVYEARLKTVHTQLEKAIKGFFPGISSSGLKTYLSSTPTLRNSIKKELDKQRELARIFGVDPRFPLDYLSTLSAAVPKDIVTDLSEFKAGTSVEDSFLIGKRSPEITAVFLVANPQTGEKLTEVLKTKMGYLQKGEIEEVGLGESGKKWKLTFTGKVQEKAE